MWVKPPHLYETVYRCGTRKHGLQASHHHGCAHRIHTNCTCIMHCFSHSLNHPLNCWLTYSVTYSSKSYMPICLASVVTHIPTPAHMCTRYTQRALKHLELFLCVLKTTVIHCCSTQQDCIAALLPCHKKSSSFCTSSLNSISC